MRKIGLNYLIVIIGSTIMETVYFIISNLIRDAAAQSSCLIKHQ